MSEQRTFGALVRVLSLNGAGTNQNDPFRYGPVQPYNIYDFLCESSEYFQDNKLDECPVACESVEFSAQLSYARYPANTHADLLAKKRNMTGTVSENRQYLRYGERYRPNAKMVAFKLFFYLNLKQQTNLVPEIRIQKNTGQSRL